MKRFFRALHRKQGGFTLIELLVVIGILAVLIAVVALNVGKFIGKGAEEASCVEANQVQIGVLSYMAENGGAIPANIAAIQPYLTGTVSGTYSWDADGKVTQTAGPGGKLCAKFGP